MSLTTSRVILPRLELNTKIVPKRLVSAKDFSKQDYVKCILVKDLTLSWQSVRLRIMAGLPGRSLPPSESLCCVHEQDTLSAA